MAHIVMGYIVTVYTVMAYIVQDSLARILWKRCCFREDRCTRRNRMGDEIGLELQTRLATPIHAAALG